MRKGSDHSEQQHQYHLLNKGSSDSCKSLQFGLTFVFYVSEMIDFMVIQIITLSYFSCIHLLYTIEINFKNEFLIFN